MIWIKRAFYLLGILAAAAVILLEAQGAIVNHEYDIGPIGIVLLVTLLFEQAVYNLKSLVSTFTNKESN